MESNKICVLKTKMIYNRKITNIKICRLCNKPGLKEIIDFGMMSLPTWPYSKEEGIKAPLKFMACPSCFLGQLAHSIDQESLFREYWYRTGINDTMRSHMRTLAEAVSKEVHLGDSDIVVDVGANDGTLLNNYKVGRLIGFEPSNLCPKEKTGILWINDFFDSKLLPAKDRGSVAALTSIAMFYYLDDPVGFAKIVESVLAPNGIWVCEMNYGLDMIKRGSFDHISHEHVTVWSAGLFNRVVQKTGLEIFRIERNELNGGSIRFWVGKPGIRPVEQSVRDTLAKEKGYFTLSTWRKFAQKVRKISKDLRKIILNLQNDDKLVMTYGSSTRGLTLLGAANLDSTLITAAVEKNTEKVGRFYGATQISVISEEEMRKTRPDALLILPYSFIAEFQKRERAYLDGGGIFVVPIPEPRVLTKSTEVLL